MSANGISTLATRELRQKAKLDLAATNRAADGNPRATYDITQLPTQYDDNSIIDNPNAGGLVVGRPWTSIAYSAGLYRSQYASWPNQNNANPTWFDGKTAAATAVATDFELTLTAGQTSRGYQWLGYFLPDYTGTWTFSTGGVNIDDTVTVWIGASALSGYTTGNAVFTATTAAGSGTVSLTSGTYYPIRVQYANNAGPGTSTLYYARTGQTTTKIFTGKLFYNSATNGF
jgi:hypothetical protein